MTNIPAQPPDTGQPLSLRDNTPRQPWPRQETGTNLALYIIMTAAMFLLVGLLIATLFYSGGDSIDKDDLRDLVDELVSTRIAALVPTSTPIPPTPTRIPNPVADDGDAFLGPEEAPVIIVEFSDFQCGYCGRFYDDTLPLILENFPNEVKFVYRDFPIFGEDSVRAAMAAECAEEQNSFWEMHDRIFKIHSSETPVTLDHDTLVSFADELGLDTAAFSECLSSERYLTEVLGDFQAAEAYGLRGTPSFVINGVVYTMGAQPFDVFAGIIHGELELAGAGS